MKIAKKILSIALTLTFVLSMVAVSAISANAKEGDIVYNDNIAVSYDQYIRDYEYGTGTKSQQPRSVTFNEDGWMRIQTQTAADIEREGAIYSPQWQYHALFTPMYTEQFKNAVDFALNDGNGEMYYYAFLNAGEIKTKSASATPGAIGTGDSNWLQLEFILNIKIDNDDDGVYEETKAIKIGTGTTMLNIENGSYYIAKKVPLDDIDELISEGIDYKLNEIVINIQNYFPSYDEIDEFAGLGKIDLAISPFFTDYIPGTEGLGENGDPITYTDRLTYDPKTSMNMNGYTINDITRDYTDVSKDGFYKEWTWEYPDQTEPEPGTGSNKKSLYKSGDIVRDPITKCPTDKNGVKYNPMPITAAVYVDPTEVTDLKATVVTKDSATITWTAKGGPAKNFTVNCSNVANPKEVINLTNVTANTATITGLKAGTQYKVRVRGTNTANMNGQFTTIYVTTASNAPATPVIKTVAYAAKNQVKVTWGAVANATGYIVYRNGVQIASLGKVTSYVDTKASAAGTYNYQVVAKGQGGNSAKSAVKAIKTMSFTAKGAVKNKVGKKQVKVSIKKAVANADGYQFQASLKKNMKSAKGAFGKTSAKIKKLKSKKVYYTRARAYKVINGKKVYGAWSAVVKAGKVK